MEQLMKKVGIEMSILMGITLSIFLSIANVIAAGRFNIINLILNILIASVVSISIGLVVPMGKLNLTLDKSLGFKPGSLPARLVEAFVSDLIYTPVVSIIMIIFNYIRVTTHLPKEVRATIPFAPMLAKGLIVSFLVGYVLIFFIQPVFMKIVFKRNGINGPLE